MNTTNGNGITSAASTETTETTQTQQVALLTVKDIKKPSRQDFYRDVVLGGDGGILDESVWKPLAGDSKGQALAGKLRKNGMQIVHVFDKPKYEEAKTAYGQNIKQARITERDFLIVDAFAKANHPVEPHIERALKDLLPIFQAVSPAKTAIVFKNIVRAAANGAGLDPAKE